jgi:hypothetical protein
MVAKSSSPGGVRKVRGGVRTRETVRQAPPPGQVEETPGDPFEALAGGQTWSSPTRTICYEFDARRIYWHRDLKYPVIVRHP